MPSIGPVDSEIALLKLKKKKETTEGKIYSPSGMFAERAKLTQAKYVARLAGLSSGLKDQNFDLLGSQSSKNF